MIQFYDDRPSDPLEAFVYFEAVFRNQFLTVSFSKENMRSYIMRLLIAKRELGLSILPEWEFEGYSEEEFEEAIFSRLGQPFNEGMFLRFERDLLSIVAKLIGPYRMGTKN